LSDLTRRSFLIGVGASFGAGAVTVKIAQDLWDRFDGPFENFRDVMKHVTPTAGFTTSVTFGDTIQRLIRAGVLDPEKLKALYQSSGGVPAWVERLLTAPSKEPIELSFKTASYLLNLLWPIGLATKTSFNDESPINNDTLPSYASTSSWSLGREPNGARYFNSVDTLSMTESQGIAALEIAQSTYRPCCNNSTYFQDCNHGSALLGIIELATAQGMPKTEVLRVALMANSFWFPKEYIKTALYLMLFEGRSWNDVAPQHILEARLSSASGWQRNVNVPIQLVDFVPRSSLIEMSRGFCRT